MVSLAKQLIQRQTGQHDPADLENLYESRLRTMLDVEIKGEGLHEEGKVLADRGNVIDLMAALKKSLGQTAPEPAQKRPPGHHAAIEPMSAAAWIFVRSERRRGPWARRRMSSRQRSRPSRNRNGPTRSPAATRTSWKRRPPTRAWTISIGRTRRCCAWPPRSRRATRATSST